MRLIPEFIKSRIRKVIQEERKKIVNNARVDIKRAEENVKAISYLDRFLSPNEPWTGWTMHPSAVLTVVNDIQINERSSVVECGSGLSTLYSAKACMEQGANLVSFENDGEWANRIRGKLQNLGLDKNADVVHAELEEWNFGGEAYLWYDEAVVRDCLSARSKVDLLVIDGPPKDTGHHARYPAIPAIREFLHDRYAIILDDIEREMERAIVKRWKQEVSARFQNDYRNRGICYARCGRSWEV